MATRLAYSCNSKNLSLAVDALGPGGDIRGMKPDLSQYVSSKQAAEIMGMHHRYVRRLCTANKLAHVRFGKVFLIVRKAAEAYQRNPFGRGRPKASDNE